MMTLLRSFVFALIFYPGTAGAVLIAFPLALIDQGSVVRQGIRWVRFHSWCVRHLLGIETRIEGVVPKEPTLFASKHQSMFETLELLRVIGDPAIVLKRELADMPFFGKAAGYYGVIPVDRAGSATALRRMMRAAAAARDARRSVLIFPEGTRVPPGEQPPLQAGFAGLYKQLRLPCVPVALDSGLLWPRRSFFKRSGVITLRFGEAIAPGLPRDEIEPLVHAAINALETDAPTAMPAQAGISGE